MGLTHPPSERQQNASTVCERVNRTSETAVVLKVMNLIDPSSIATSLRIITRH